MIASALHQAVSMLLAGHAEQVSSDVGAYDAGDNIKFIVTKPDNVPILMMIVIFGFFTYLALRDGFKHDKLIKEGRKQDVLKSMQE